MSPWFSEVAEAFKPWREMNVRTAYRPVTRAGSAPEHRSQFGGTPLLRKGEGWPKCGRCSRPLSLLLQLDLATLPKTGSHLVSGLLQVFYCINEAGCDDYAPFSPCHHLRVVSDNEHLLEPFSGTTPDYLFPTVNIVAWERFDDWPDGMEHERLGLRYEYDFTRDDTITDVHWDDGDLHFCGLIDSSDDELDVASAIASAASGDKLYGWPHWIQNVEYPSCPTCNREMEYLFQIDSKDNLPYMFGDCGCGHISFCPDHPEVLAFTWACS